MGDELGPVRLLAHSRLSEAEYKLDKLKGDRRLAKLGLALGVTLLVWLFALASLAHAQEATITTDEAGIELSCDHGNVRVDATTTPQISPEFPAQCESSDGAVLLNLVWFCGIENSGQVQAWTDGEYTGYFTVYLNVLDCSMGRPITFKQVFCGSSAGTAYINLPVYDEEVEMHVWCE